MYALNSTNCILNFGLHCLFIHPNQRQIDLFFSSNKCNVCTQTLRGAISITSFIVSSFRLHNSYTVLSFCNISLVSQFFVYLGFDVLKLNTLLGASWCRWFPTLQLSTTNPREEKAALTVLTVIAHTFLESDGLEICNIHYIGIKGIDMPFTIRLYPLVMWAILYFSRWCFITGCSSSTDGCHSTFSFSLFSWFFDGHFK